MLNLSPEGTVVVIVLILLMILLALWQARCIRHLNKLLQNYHNASINQQQARRQGSFYDNGGMTEADAAFERELNGKSPWGGY